MSAGKVPTPEEILESLRRTGALMEGHFELTSGLHSPRFALFSQVLQYPAEAERIGVALAAQFQDMQVDTVAGPAMGGVILAHETARALGVRGIFAEKAADGMTLRRGFRLREGERVLVVEDAVSTGGSVRRAMEAIRAVGGRIVAVGSVVDWTGGTAEFGVPFRPLLALSMPRYQPQECPLCREGRPLILPKNLGMQGER